MSLSSSCENFVESFVVGKDSLTLEEVKAALDIRELRQKVIGDNGESGNGLFVKSRKSKKKKSFNKGNNTGSSAENNNEGSSKIAGKTCYYHKELGHFRVNYPVRKGKSQATIVEEKPKKNIIRRKTWH